MTELPEDAWVEYVDDLQRKRYRSHLAAHPDPRDPDYPEPEDYGLDEEENA